MAEIELDLEIIGQIETAKEWINFYKKNFAAESAKLKHNFAKFRFLRFTIIYVISDFVLGFVAGSIIFAKDADILPRTILLTLALFIPYLIFLPVFLVIYIFQQIYLFFRTLVSIIKHLTKRDKRL